MNVVESKPDTPSEVDDLNLLEVALSPERLHRYRASSNNDLSKAIQLYLWNTNISQALYGPLQVLEVTTRNSINRQFCAKFGTNWYQNSDPILFVDPQAEKISKVVSRFDKPRPITVGDVVADLSFGFWSDLIDHQIYDELWKTTLHKAFPNRPKGTKRNTAAIPFKRLNTLRNRIAHHEPIYNRDLEYDYNLTIEILSWICPTTSHWAAINNNFKAQFAVKPR